VKKFAIIAEYNPLHSGHLYHLKETKKTADRVIVIMSGSFTQRGDPAIDNKYRRAYNAICAGADMVIELPTLYAVSPAEKFAYGALKTLSVMNVDYLSFGSESGDIKALIKAAGYINNETEEIRALIRKGLNLGNPLVKARSYAYKQYNEEHIELRPNNTLGIEYLKAIKDLHLHITPVTVKRLGNAIDNIDTSGEHISATAIRNAIYNNEFYTVSDYVPYSIRYNLNTISNYEKLIMYKLYTMTSEELEKIFDVTEGLNNRIINSLKISDYNVFMMSLKTKRYTMARLKRIFIASLLSITKDFYNKCLIASPYVNVLAIRADRKDMLSEINTKNIITKPSDIRIVSDDVKPLIELDTLAHRILNLINEDSSNINSMQIVN